MDYSITIAAMIAFIENRLQSELDYAELERAMGLSLSRTRAIFARHTGKSLSRYILGRKVAHAAFDLIHSRQSILEIAMKYGFSGPDTFTRAFRRVTALNPGEFRKRRCAAGSAKLYGGMYGVSEKAERTDRMNNSVDGSMVLYGVPKVGYGVYGCTPYPICLKSVANYLGEDADYDYIMCMCGAAFRLTWDVTGWYGGNVDVCYTFDEYETVYALGVEGLGRKYDVLSREPQTKKQEFIGFIKERIDRGYPCIATGIIGPPEACVVTGYREDGEVLLGWNFFQDSVPYGSKKTAFDESGYFVSRDWWENEGTQSVMGIGEVTGPKRTAKEIVATAIEVLSGRRKDQFAKGILAYDAWKRALANDSDFSGSYAMMAERIMCQGDAMDCLADGRGSAKSYFESLAGQNPGQRLYRDIAKFFGGVEENVRKMAEALGGWQRGEAQMEALAKPEIRGRICGLIEACKAADQKALDSLAELNNSNH